MADQIDSATDMTLPAASSTGHSSATLPLDAVPRRRLWLTALGLALAGVAISWLASDAIFYGVSSPQQQNQMIWFDSDAREVIYTFTDRTSPLHWRMKNHPFFGLVITVPMTVAKKVTPFEEETLVRILLAVVSGATAGMFFFLCLYTAGSTLAAITWTSVLLASSGFIFWTGVPDSYAIGMLSILIPFVPLALRNTFKLPIATWTVSLLASLCITTTNAMSGVAVSLLAVGPRKSISVLKSVALVIIIGLVIQSTLVRHSTDGGLFFLQHQDAEQQRWVNRSELGGMRSRVETVLVSGVVLPEVGEPWTRDAYDGGGIMLTVQSRAFTRTGKLGAGLWVLLLSLGVYVGFITKSADRKLFLAVLSVAVGQIALHALYGLDVFVYSAHYAPILILLASFASRARERLGGMVTLGAAALACVALFNNVEQFRYCVEIVRDSLPSAF